MALSVVAIALGIFLFGAGGLWLYDGGRARAAAGLVAQVSGMALGVAGLITLVLPDFFG